MQIGTVFEQTSTTEFRVMLNQVCDSEQLLFSYVELSPDGGVPNSSGERIIARIKNAHKENPLLSSDQAGILASVSTGGLGFDFSTRFTHGWAECSVIGALRPGRGLDMNRRAIMPNAEVHTPSTATLRELFFDANPDHVPLGTIETFRGQGVDEVPVTLDADELVTKHFCIFGMTGSGKTNTAAKLLEELMARGHRMILFDSHDDYLNLENYTNLFDRDNLGNRTQLRLPSACDAAIQAAMSQANATPTDNRPLQQCLTERLLRTASVIYSNTPARNFLEDGAGHTSSPPLADRISPPFVNELTRDPHWQTMLREPQVRHLRVFPELCFYGNGFQDFTLGLLESFAGEAFSDAQRREMYQILNQGGTGLTYIRNLRNAIGQIQRDDTRNALDGKMRGVIAVYNSAGQAGATALNIQAFFNEVADRNAGNPQSVYRLSLIDLSANLRKAMVYAVVTYFFRQFKFGGYRATGQTANAYPLLFVLEEARSLIPKSSGQDDADVAGDRARRAMRELAYEGRKFSLGFGLISQKPSTVDQEVVSQSNTFILHQLKSPDDQQYVRAVTESMSQEELEMIKSLGAGRVIVAGTAVDSPVLLRVFFRYSAEGVREPTPIRDQLRRNVTQIRQRLQAPQNAASAQGARPRAGAGATNVNQTP